MKTTNEGAAGSPPQKVPEKMRAAVVERFGGPEALSIGSLPVPTVDDNEVLIAVHTAGVGSWDAEMRAGWSPSGRPRFPLVLGSDGSGWVAALGRKVRRLEIGDPVYAFSFDSPKGGFYAEYCSVVAEWVAPLPSGLGMEQAGAVATTGLTALQGIDGALKVKEGEAVLIHGASGGVGTLAVQFAKLRGARVLATASGDDGVSLARRLGADAAVDGHSQDIAALAREFARDGLDAVLALAGGDALERCLDGLRADGRLAYPNGIDPEPKKRRGIHVVTYDAAPGVRELEQLGRAMEAAKLQVPIAGAYPLAEARSAHARLEQGHVLGKIVLRIR